MRRLILLLFGCTVATALGMLNTAGVADEIGVTDTAIKIGVVTPITGVQAHYGASHKTVTELVAKEVNSGGGINGRKVELIIEDEGCSGTKARAAIQKLVTRDQGLRSLRRNLCSSHRSKRSFPNRKQGAVSDCDGDCGQPD
jgi:branched-chain amino acid transport system substrate-binding protein